MGEEIPVFEDALPGYTVAGRPDYEDIGVLQHQESTEFWTRLL